MLSITLLIIINCLIYWMSNDIDRCLSKNTSLIQELFSWVSLYLNLDANKWDVCRCHVLKIYWINLEPFSLLQPWASSTLNIGKPGWHYPDGNMELWDTRIKSQQLVSPPPSLSPSVTDRNFIQLRYCFVIKYNQMKRTKNCPCYCWAL